ncbi:MAG: phosphatase PAP2 family protein [Chloroflexota bacterium]
MSQNHQPAEKQAVKVVKQPVNAWRRTISRAGAIVGKPWRRYRASLFQTYLVGAVIIFLVLAFAAKTVAYFTFDVTITQEVQEIQMGWFAALMHILSWIGFSPQGLIISVLIFLFLWVSGLKWETIVSAVSLIGSTLLGLGLKLLVQRPRPAADLVNVFAQLKDTSFPSGHVLFFTTFFGFMLFLAYTLPKPSWWRTLLLIILGAMVALIGISRIYEGQHWASDVLAAYLLGTIWLSGAILIYRWGKPRYFANQPVAKEAS